MSERKKIIRRRIICGIFVVVLFVFPIIYNLCKPELKLLNTEWKQEKDYYCLYLTFNMEVYSDYAIVSFYDADGNLLETNQEWFSAHNEKVAEDYCVRLDDNKENLVSYCVVESFDIGSTFKFGWVYSLWFFDLLWFIGALLLSYKEYDYNGEKISVYAGWYHHTLKVNGVIFDEHNTIGSFTPIYLSTTLNDGTDIKASISLMNRIAVKANNRLITSRRAFFEVN